MKIKGPPRLPHHHQPAISCVSVASFFTNVLLLYRTLVCIWIHCIETLEILGGCGVQSLNMRHPYTTDMGGVEILRKSRLGYLPILVSSVQIYRRDPPATFDICLSSSKAFRKPESIPRRSALKIPWCLMSALKPLNTFIFLSHYLSIHGMGFSREIELRDIETPAVKSFRTFTS